MKSIGRALFILLFWKLCLVANNEYKEAVILDARDTYLERMEQLADKDGYKLQCAEVVVAQMIHETGYFTSDIYKTGHNLFGMKVPHRRPKVWQMGEYKGHARYYSNAHSLCDYIAWQKWTTKNGKIQFKNNEEYYNHLLRTGYAEDKKYIEKVRNIVKIINFK